MKSLTLATLATLTAALAVPAAAETVLNAEKATLYEADYAAVLEDNDIVVGVAVYGQHDADFDAFLTDASLFQPLLGNNDADYEALLDHAGYAAAGAGF